MPAASVPKMRGGGKARGGAILTKNALHKDLSRTATGVKGTEIRAADKKNAPVVYRGKPAREETLQ